MDVKRLAPDGEVQACTSNTTDPMYVDCAAVRQAGNARAHGRRHPLPRVRRLRVGVRDAGRFGWVARPHRPDRLAQRGGRDLVAGRADRHLGGRRGGHTGHAPAHAAAQVGPYREAAGKLAELLRRAVPSLSSDEDEHGDPAGRCRGGVDRARLRFTVPALLEVPARLRPNSRERLRDRAVVRVAQLRGDLGCRRKAVAQTHDNPALSLV